MRYSFIIPVFNRPDEVNELLDSMLAQSVTDFEVIVVEDGSSVPCESVCDKYAGRLNVRYYFKDNSGPGPSRNFGADKALGDYVIILDSDVVLPPDYLAKVDAELQTESCDAFGGPDRAGEGFTMVQKAISYSMTSFFTTGGIRGGKNKLDRFYPRSFNMGIRRDAFIALHGFSRMRFGEDIDFSYRIIGKGYSCRLFPGAWVWHKRRTDFDKFFKQVFNSGIARINLEKRHPHSMKLVHMLPMLFTLGVVCLSVLALLLRFTAPGLWWMLPLLPIFLFSLTVFVDSSVRNHSLQIGILSVEAAFIQLFGYGLGFLSAVWNRCVLGKGEFSAYEKTFYD
ncbi:MAG: glycosyltransferase [Bacteroidaceae bacterium]|nr:glycosyltransferase [Bacteroidaceae bacterium]